MYELSSVLSGSESGDYEEYDLPGHNTGLHGVYPRRYNSFSFNVVSEFLDSSSNCKF
jgi:hypothetical protein